MDAVKSVCSPSVREPTSMGGSGTNYRGDTARCTHCVRTVRTVDASLPAVRYTTSCRSQKMLGRSTSGAILWHSATAATYSGTDNFFYLIGGSITQDLWRPRVCPAGTESYFGPSISSQSENLNLRLRLSHSQTEIFPFSICECNCCAFAF